MTKIVPFKIGNEFIIRPLEESEWGSQGKCVCFYMQFVHGKFKALASPKTNFDPFVIIPPDRLNIELDFSKDCILDTSYNLYSVDEDKEGPNLVDIFDKIHYGFLKNRNIFLLENGEHEASVIIEVPITIKFHGTRFRYYAVEKGLVELGSIEGSIEVHIRQLRVDIDKEDKYDFILVLENEKDTNKQVFYKLKNKSDIVFSASSFTEKSKILSDKDRTLVKNGDVFSIILNRDAKREENGREKYLNGQRVIFDLFDDEKGISMHMFSKDGEIDIK